MGATCRSWTLNPPPSSLAARGAIWGQVIQLAH